MSIDRCKIVKSIIEPHLAEGETIVDAPESNGEYTVTLTLPTGDRATELYPIIAGKLVEAGFNAPGVHIAPTHDAEHGLRLALELRVRVGDIRSL